MPFLQAAQQSVADPATPRDVRLTLEFLLANAVGRNNAVPIGDILEHLEDNGVNIGPSKFQTTILAQSRIGEVFIGSGQKGYFLIEDESDARAMLEFYEARIESERQRVQHFRALADASGFNI